MIKRACAALYALHLHIFNSQPDESANSQQTLLHLLRLLHNHAQALQLYMACLVYEIMLTAKNNPSHTPSALRYFL